MRRPDLYRRYEETEDELRELQQLCLTWHRRFAPDRPDLWQCERASFYRVMESIKASRLDIEEDQAAIHREWEEWVAWEATKEQGGKGGGSSTSG